MTEVPTTLSPDGRSRPPHLRSWRDGWRHLRFLLQFSPAWLFFYPGLLLLLSGVAAMVWLVPQPRSAAGVGFGVNTLVFAAAGIICGFQAIAFYVFAKTYGIRAGLLPEDDLVMRLREILRLETGLIVGLTFVVIGLALASYALGTWEDRAFGPLNPEQSLRTVIPSATLLILGIQLMLSSSLLSIMQLETRSPAARTRLTDRQP